MFWDKKSKEEGKKEKLTVPRDIPGPVQNYLVAETKLDLDLVKPLKAVIRKTENGESPTHIRVLDNSDAIARKIQVKNWASLDEHPDLTLYDGWFNKRSKQVKLGQDIFLIVFLLFILLGCSFFDNEVKHRPIYLTDSRYAHFREGSPFDPAPWPD
jgi:hypothetical protein